MGPHSGSDLPGARGTIALDAQILVDSVAAAYVRRFTQGACPWAITWHNLHEFVAIVTNPRIDKPPTPLAAALSQIGYWAWNPSLRLLGPSHWVPRALVTEWLTRNGIRGAGVLWLNRRRINGETGQGINGRRGRIEPAGGKLENGRHRFP